MEPSSTIQQRFVERFHCGSDTEPFLESELAHVEQALDTKLPLAYRAFVTRFGAVCTPSILDGLASRSWDPDGRGPIVRHGQEPEVIDVQYFLRPTEIVDNTAAYWSGGMPQDLIAFASDCMGNMIGFRRAAVPNDDAPVLVFDHDYVRVAEIAPAFDSWLEWYLDSVDVTPSRTNSEQ